MKQYRTAGRSRMEPISNLYYLNDQQGKRKTMAFWVWTSQENSIGLKK